MRSLPLDPSDLANWRSLCEYVETWLASNGTPSRRRSSIHYHEVPEPLRFLLATRTHPLGLSPAQLREVRRARGEVGVLWWGSTPGEGWTFRTRRGQRVWRERLAELEGQRV